MTYPVLRPSWRPPIRTRWGPIGDLADFRAEMLGMLRRLGTLAGDGITDEVDIEETDDGWTITAPIPGVAPDQVRVEVEGSDLNIRTKVEEEQQGNGSATRKYAFSCQVTIPGEFDPEQIEANMEHGLLTIRVPRASGSQRHQITVSGKG